MPLSLTDKYCYQSQDVVVFPSFITRWEWREIITVFHPAASELLNAINIITTTSPKSSHIITSPVALTPALSIERNPNIFVVTIRISVWVVIRAAALCFFNLMQVFLRAYSDAVQVVAIRTECPDVVSEKEN